MPKGMKKASATGAATVPNESPEAVHDAPAAQPKRAARAPSGGKIAGRIVAEIGAVPAGVTHYQVHQIGPDGRTIEKKTLTIKGVAVDEFPIEALHTSGIDVVKFYGPGRYQLAWIATDARGARSSKGKSKRIEIVADEAPAKKRATPVATSGVVDREAMRAEIREEVMRELGDSIAFRDKMRDDATQASLTQMQTSFTQALQLALAVRQAEAPTASVANEEVQQLRLELAIEKAKREAREEFEDELDDLREELEELRGRGGRADNPGPDGMLGQIAQAADLVPKLAPLLPLLASLAPKPQPVAVSVAPSAPAPKRVNKKQPPSAPPAASADNAAE